MTLKRTDDVVSFLASVATRSDRGELPGPYGVFARTYHRMTLEMVVAISDGSFEKPAAMSRFVAAFADKYRIAIEGNPGPVADAWQVSFDTAEPGKVLRAMLTGINAHMARDLVITLVDDTGVDPSARRDYDMVNTVLARAIDPVQRIVEGRYAHWMRLADALGRRVDEVLSVESFEKTRSRAWRDAEGIINGSYSRARLEKRVARRGRALALLPL